ncbi:MAG TPA: dipeptidase PepV [Clostridiales bacterium]|nr:dipeptidase PepV [Clostridiales bacterium]
MIIGNEILNYREDIIRSLCELIKIKSVADTPREGKPFGEGVNRALEYVLSLGESLGLKTKNVDGYAGHVEYGEGEEITGVLVHLDIVPEGTGWTIPPFEGIVNEGKIYGRGASDNKGPAIAAVYGLKALKDSGIIPKRKIRVILGTNEETGMQDMQYYFSKEPVPDLGFSPDAMYPIINREKGILHLALIKNEHDKGKNIYGDKYNGSCNDNFKKGCKYAHEFPIWKIWGGEAVNMVPDECRAQIPAEFIKLKDVVYLQELAKKNSGENILISFDTNNGLNILAKGKSAHGASPQSGVNAVYGLLDFLHNAENSMKSNGNEENAAFSYMDNYLKFIYEKKIGSDTTGHSLGIDLKDEESGALTLNLGKIDYNQAEKRVLLDIRYPVTCKYEGIVETIKEQAGKEGIQVEVVGHSLPLYVSATHPLITKLSNAYEKITGEKANLLSMGGGTYARTLKNNGVAFGGVGEGAHQPDENVSIEDLMRHAEICTQAIYEIAT